MAFTARKYCNRDSLNSYSGNLVDKGHHHARRVVTLHHCKTTRFRSSRTPRYLLTIDRSCPVPVHQKEYRCPRV